MTPLSIEGAEEARPLGGLAFLAGTLCALPWALTLATGNSLSHDEHQHLAAGVLFGRDGLLPYRDFAYFHFPYLIYIYGLLGHLSGHYLLASRLFSAACAALTCGAIAGASWTLFARSPPWQRLLIGAGTLALQLGVPLFTGTAGHSWNQEPSVLCVLLAFLALPAEPPSRWARLLLCGLLAGVAIGFRITVAPLVLPLALLAMDLQPGPARGKLARLATFGGGLTLGLAPAAWAFYGAPAGFIFGNVEFPSVNIAYRLASGEPRTMTLGRKLRFFVKLVMGPNWALCYGFPALWLAARFRAPASPGPHRLLRRVVLLLPFLLLGALAPSPAFTHYFYPLVPFLVLGGLYALAGMPAAARGRRWVWGAAALAAAVTTGSGAHEYRLFSDLLVPSKWVITRIEAESRALRARVPAGRVLTLAPTWPLEAGLDIYPEFVTGPFGWRVAPFVPRAHRLAVKLTAPEDLAARLQPDPPAAVLLGFDPRWEAPLAAYASAHGYRSTAFGNKQLWLPPGLPAH